MIRAKSAQIGKSSVKKLCIAVTFLSLFIIATPARSFDIPKHPNATFTGEETDQMAKDTMVIRYNRSPLSWQQISSFYSEILFRSGWKQMQKGRDAAATMYPDKLYFIRKHGMVVLSFILQEDETVHYSLTVIESPRDMMKAFDAPSSRGNKSCPSCRD